MANETKSRIGHKIAPAQKPELLPYQGGYLKIRLTYLTMEPKHVRNAMLRIQGIEPPYIEDVCILMPCAKAVDMIEAYMLAFQYLQDAGLVPPGTKLQSFKVLLEDDITLAYLF